MEAKRRRKDHSSHRHQLRPDALLLDLTAFARRVEMKWEEDVSLERMGTTFLFTRELLSGRWSGLWPSSWPVERCSRRINIKKKNPKK